MCFAGYSTGLLHDIKEIYLAGGGISPEVSGQESRRLLPYSGKADENAERGTEDKIVLRYY